jgi:hypothetical protein
MVVPWATSSLGLGPPTNPVRFTRDLAKASIEDKGRVVVLNETELRLVDAAAFKRIVRAVALFADDLGGLLNGASAASAAPLFGPPSTGRLQTLRMLDEHVQIRYVASDWRSQRTGTSGTYQFEHSSGVAYVRVISEAAQIPKNTMAEIFLGNARKADPDAKLSTSELTAGATIRDILSHRTGVGMTSRCTGHRARYSRFDTTASFP